MTSNTGNGVNKVDANVSMAKIENEYRLTITGKTYTYGAADKATSTQLESASGPVTLTNVDIDADTTVSVPVRFQSVNNTVTAAPGTTMTITAPLESAKGSITTFGGGGTFVFDLTSKGTDFLGKLAIGSATKLIINTAISGLITLEPSGILKGIGPFNDVTNNGIMWGGNSIETVPLASYTCGAKSETVVEFNPVIIPGSNSTLCAVT